MQVRGREWGLSSDGSGDGLGDTEHFCRSVVTVMAEGVVVHDAIGRIIACNNSALEILGLTRDQLTQRTSLDPRWRTIREDGSVFPGEEHPATVTLRTGRPCFGVIMGVMRTDATLVWISINTQPIVPEGSTLPAHVVVSFLDITEKRNAEWVLRESEERYRQLAELAPVGIFRTDPEGGCIFLNPRATEITGLSLEEAVGAGWVNALHPDDAARVTAEWAATVATGREFAAEYRFMWPDGQIRWVSGQARVLRDQHGAVTGYLGSVTDITARKGAEEERDRFFDLSLDLLCVARLDTQLVRVNQAFTRTLGYAPDALLGRRFLDHVHPDDLEAARLALARLEEGEPVQNIELRCRAHDGSWRWLAWACPPPAPDTGLLYAIARDISERKDAEQKLRAQAEMDSLTGLANRATFRSRLEAAIDQAARDGRTVGLLYLDLNQFKAVNDTLGHEAGDQLLIRVAQRLRTCVRRGDLIARLGGDEFSIMLEGLERSTITRVIAQKVIDRISEPIKVGNAEMAVGVSIGIACYPKHASTAKQLIHHADTAMYQAKKGGGGRFVMWSVELA